MYSLLHAKHGRFLFWAITVSFLLTVQFVFVLTGLVFFLIECLEATDRTGLFCTVNKWFSDDP